MRPTATTPDLREMTMAASQISERLFEAMFRHLQSDPVGRDEELHRCHRLVSDLEQRLALLLPLDAP